MDTKLKRTVALKLLPTELLRDKEEKLRFTQGVQAAASLNHTNICTVYEIDKQKKQTLIAMEYFEEQSLKELQVQLSKHLFLSQLDQPEAYGCEAVPYPEEWIQERAVVLASVVEVICQELGFPPLKITSGYRSREFNRALRAAGYFASEKSQHCEGRAVDLSFDGVSSTEVFCAALHCHHRGLIRLRGLGLYSRWVHIGIGPGKLLQWFR